MVFSVQTVNYRLTFFAETNNIAQTDAFRRTGQREAAADPALCREITAATEIMHHLDEMMARDAKRQRDFRHGEPLRAAQGGLHQNPDGVIRIGAQFHFQPTWPRAGVNAK